jgi:integrase
VCISIYHFHGKNKFFLINDNLKHELNNYIEEFKLKSEDYLISSRKTDHLGHRKPISRVQAHHILKDVAKEFSLQNFGCHSLRKTFGYHFYKKHKDVVTLMKIFNHSSQQITMKYIGIEQEQIDMVIKEFSL